MKKIGIVSYFKYLLFISLFFSCSKAYYNGKKNTISSLPVNDLHYQTHLLFKDSNLTILITNHSKDPLYFDTVFTRYFIGFTDVQPIFKNGITHVSDAALYPLIVYPKRVLKKMISNNCYDLFNSKTNSKRYDLIKNIFKLIPDSSYKKEVDIFNTYNIERFEKKLQYKMFVKVYFPYGCKGFFPCIDTGYLKSDTLEISFD